MKLRIGIIGTDARWQKIYWPALQQMRDRFRVTAVYDEVGHRAKIAAEICNARVFDSYRALIDRDDVDAVFILTHQWHEILPVLAACELGKAVYWAGDLWSCDDACSSRQSRMIREAIDSSGITMMFELPCRYMPATLRLQELMATKLGRPQLIFCHKRLGVGRSETFNRNRVDTFGSHTVQGRISHDIQRELAHLVDWCNFVVGGGPESLVGISHSQRSSDQVSTESDDSTEPCDSKSSEGCEENYRMLSLEYQGAAVRGRDTLAQVSVGAYLPEDWSEAIAYRPLAGMQVRCEKGIAFLDLPSRLIWFDEAGRHQEKLDDDLPAMHHLLMQFFRAVTSLVQNRELQNQPYTILDILDAARTSYESGQRVRLNEQDRE